MPDMTALAHGDVYATECYLKAAALSEKAAEMVVQQIKSGASLGELSKLGDDVIGAESKGECNNGLSHPCAVSVNHVVCNYASNTLEPRMQAGDLVKVQIGAQVDGYGVFFGRNVICPGSTDNDAVEQDKTEIMQVTTQIAEKILSLIKPGMRAWDVADTIDTMLKLTKFRGCIGLNAHNQTRYDMQGPKSLNLFFTPEQRADPANDVIFEEGEVWSYECWLNNAEDPVPVPSKNLPATLYSYLGHAQDLDHFALSENEARLAEYLDKTYRGYAFNERDLSQGYIPVDLQSLVDKRLMGNWAPYVLEDEKGTVASLSVGSYIVGKKEVRLLNSKVY